MRGAIPPLLQYVSIPLYLIKQGVHLNDMVTLYYITVSYGPIFVHLISHSTYWTSLNLGCSLKVKRRVLFWSIITHTSTKVTGCYWKEQGFSLLPSPMHLLNGTGGSLPRDKGAGAWNCPVTSMAWYLIKYRTTLPFILRFVTPTVREDPKFVMFLKSG
jgi:hypothetical protein